jgi:hypothetical protein
MATLMSDGAIVWRLVAVLYVTPRTGPARDGRIARLSGLDGIGIGGI